MRAIRRMTLLALALATPAGAALDTPGFRAVPVALAHRPISAMAVAPDGRLFAALQTHAATEDGAPGTSEIRVYSQYAQTDGSTLDQGATWAVIETVRATSREEGVLGLALAPDFATSKLVYVQLTTTDQEANQHVRVYRDRGDGSGEYFGTVAQSLEPRDESNSRHGGPLAFGSDGCLLAGVGDGGNYQGGWNAQVLAGTDPIDYSEYNDWCAEVCLAPVDYIERINDDGLPNMAGKVVKFAVQGASTAQPAQSPPIADAPFVFGTGMRNPAGLAVHPLTGQVWVADSGDTQEAELDVVRPADDLGWPCLEGSLTGDNLSCLDDQTPADVLAQHSGWRAPLVTHAGYGFTMGGVTTYTGLGYPDEFFGDVFYVVRDGARIYRVDLSPPCFMPGDAEREALVFHDSDEDGDFRAFYDADDDGELDTIYTQDFTAIVQGPTPFGNDMLYVAARRSRYDDESDSVIYRIEYATSFVPYGGATGRVPESCFAGTDDPFTHPTCLPPGGSCPGQPDGTACDDGDPCNGSETCHAGICRHDAAADSEGAACTTSDGCHGPGTCHAGSCQAGPPLPDGTACPDAEPCNGTETCAGGVCQPATGPAPLQGGSLVVKSNGAIVLHATVAATGDMDPSARDVVALRLDADGATVFESRLDHPASDGHWRKRGRAARYRDGSGSAGGLTRLDVRSRRDTVNLDGAGRAPSLGGLSPASMDARVIVGQGCFTGSLPCTKRGRGMRCKSR